MLLYDSVIDPSLSSVFSKSILSHDTFPGRGPPNGLIVGFLLVGTLAHLLALPPTGRLVEYHDTCPLVWRLEMLPDHSYTFMHTLDHLDSYQYVQFCARCPFCFVTLGSYDGICFAGAHHTSLFSVGRILPDGPNTRTVCLWDDSYPSKGRSPEFRTGRFCS